MIKLKIQENFIKKIGNFKKRVIIIYGNGERKKKNRTLNETYKRKQAV